MPYIMNVSMGAIQTGNHPHPEPGDELIQIVDPTSEFPTPKYGFGEVHQFKFLDTDDETGDMSEFAFTAEQAKEIAFILQDALLHGANVIVHCHAGLCRSGAVAEVGVMMGFEDAKHTRIPNVLVKRKLLEALGWSYSSEEVSPIDMTDSKNVIAAMKAVHD